MIIEKTNQQHPQQKAKQFKLIIKYTNTDTVAGSSSAWLRTALCNSIQSKRRALGDACAYAHARTDTTPTALPNVGLAEPRRLLPTCRCSTTRAIIIRRFF